MEVGLLNFIIFLFKRILLLYFYSSFCHNFVKLLSNQSIK